MKNVLLKLRQKISLLPAFAILLVPSLAYAGTTNAQVSSPLNNVDSLEQLIVNIINWILILIGFVAVLYLIWSGFKYVTAGGDSKKAGEAKEGITHAIIGIAIAMVAVLLVQFLYTSILDVDSNITNNVFG